MDSPKKLCLLSAIIYFMYSSTSDAACSLPDELKSSTWEYNYTQIIDSSEQSATISIGKTTMQTSVIYDVQGTKIYHWTCINSLNILNTQDVVVFKSDRSFTIGGPFGSNRWLYLCMKITKVTDDLFYFHLLSDVFTDVTPNERFFSPDGSAPNYNGPICSTFCQYTGSPKIRTLRKQGTNDVLPNDPSLCEPCDSACDVAMTCDYPDTVPHTTNVTSGNELDDTINLSCSVGYNKNSGDEVLTCKADGKWNGSPMICSPVTCPNPSAVVSVTILVQTGSNYLDTISYQCATGYELSSGNLVRTCKEGKHWDGSPPVCNASCSLPTDIKNSAWQYNYTKVSDNSPQSTILRVSTTTLQNSVINLNVVGTTIRDWTCIDSLTLSNTQTLVLFKSDESFTNGPSEGNRWLYLCMKFTKVTKDLYYFYLLSDISNVVTPNERVFVSEEGNRPAYDAPMCSTFCKYTGSPKIRTLRRPETRDEIPFDAALCEPCDSACQLATTQKQSIPPMSTAIGTSTSVIWIETKQNATKPSTSIEIDSTTQITSEPSVSTDIDRTITITLLKTTLIGTSVKNTVSEILNHYTGLIIAGGLIISGLLVVIAIYCLIKKRQKDPSKYTSTNVTNKEEEKVSHIYSEPSEVYHEYSEPSEVYHEYSEPSEVYHEYSEPARVFHVYRGRQHGYEETIFQE